MANLTEENIREILWVYRDRLVDLKKDPRLVYGMVFKNVGAAAGASLEHSHSQLIVTPIVPINVWEEMTGSLEFFNYRGRCIYCDMIHQELAAEKRIVLDTPNFVAFAPFASRFPFETWILPKNHNSHYENIQKNEVDELGTVLKTILLKLEIGAGQAGVQLHHPHVAVRHAGAAALSLAHGDHSAADARGRLRVGHGLLHQPGAAGAGGGVPARDGGGCDGGPEEVASYCCAIRVTDVVLGKPWRTWKYGALLR